MKTTTINTQMITEECSCPSTKSPDPGLLDAQRRLSQFHKTPRKRERLESSFSAVYRVLVQVQNDIEPEKHPDHKEWMIKADSLASLLQDICAALKLAFVNCRELYPETNDEYTNIQW